MIQKDITVGSHNVHLRFSYRASLLFEDLLRTYDGKTIDHPTMLFYCALKAGQTHKGVNFEMDYEQFLEFLDEYPEMRMVILTISTEYMSSLVKEEKKK